MTTRKVIDCVRLVTQDKPWRCSHACLAMVTGRPIQDVVARCGEYPIPNEIMLAYIAIGGVQFGMVEKTGGLPKFPGLYLCAIPSLNMPGLKHCIVVDAYAFDTPSDLRWRVYDPAHKGNKWNAERFEQAGGALEWICVYPLRRIMTQYLIAESETWSGKDMQALRSAFELEQR